MSLPSTPKLFVASLPYALDDAQLQAHFTQVGEVVSARVAREPGTNRSRGIGFVEMANVELAAKAIELLHNSTLGGRSILVQESRPKTERPGQGPHNARPRSFDGPRRP